MLLLRQTCYKKRLFLYAAPLATFLFLFTIHLLTPSPVKANAYATDQISDFTRARPGTEEILEDGGKVRQFLIEAFSGLYTSVPLAWDPTEPNDNAYAEHKPSLNRKFINIRVSSLLSPLDQVACVVYESMNAQNEYQFTEITEEAHKGLMTKTEFIHNILRLEHKSLKKTRAFLIDQPPYRDVDLSQTIFFSKMYGTPEHFDDFIAYLHRIKRVEYDVFKHYSDFYDFIIPPTKRWKANQKKKAEKTPAPPPVKKTLNTR